MEKAALVLEGGALRGVYTAGILDAFIENNLSFEYVLGVSAGSLCGLNYISNQKGRTAQVNLGYNHDPRYLSYRNRLKKGAVFNIDYLFEEPAGRWDAFDFEAYYQDKRTFVIGATSCQTGKLKLFEKPVGDNLVTALKASCAMPLAAKKISIANEEYLDGGVADAIPYQAALKAGYEKIVVVKTQYHDYRKKNFSSSNQKLLKAFYRHNPLFLEALITRPQRYNAQMDQIANLHQQGKLFVIEPLEPVHVSHMEKDKAKLRSLYQGGLAQAKALMPELKSYLQSDGSL
ncbi:patatin family protein [Eubacteriaceae bacterium ES3]|nr:patatin family protein [Eubacteriaceae bacterium ES3]